jgi:ATP-binding cassette subfamily C exporter for protease/lipase
MILEQLRYITKFLRPYKQELFLALILSAITNVLLLVPTLYMLQLFDRVMISKSTFSLIAITVICMFLLIIQAASEYYRSKVVVAIGIKLDQTISTVLFQSSFKRQLRDNTESASQIFNDLAVVRQWLTGAGLFPILDLPWSPIYILVMFLLHPILGWLTLTFILVLFGLSVYASHYLGDALTQADDEERQVDNYVHTRLKNVETIDVLGMFKPFYQTFMHLQTKVIGNHVAVSTAQSKLSEFTQQIRMFLSSLALGAAALLVIEGELTIGAMIAAALLMSRATSPIDMIAAGWRSYVDVKNSLIRLESFTSETTTSKRDSFVSERFDSISLSDVVLEYPGATHPILNCTSFSFKCGKTYVITGKSGCGKTSFFKALLGLIPPISGSIYYGNVPIEQIDDCLSLKFGYLPQEIELFETSLAENIGKLQPIDPEKIIQAAKITELHDFILKLPEGYETVLGSEAIILSGGQRQRVALARAIYDTPDIVILDEPNSYLDHYGDRALLSAIQYLKGINATVFISTHRDELLSIADQILSIEDFKLSVIK